MSYTRELKSCQLRFPPFFSLSFYIQTGGEREAMLCMLGGTGQFISHIVFVIGKYVPIYVCIVMNLASKTEFSKYAVDKIWSKLGQLLNGKKTPTK